MNIKTSCDILCLFLPGGISQCFAWVFCITYFLSLVGGWQQEQATVLWHGWFYVVRNAGVRAVYWFYNIQLSALKIFFFHYSCFASLLLPIWDTRREYFPSGSAFLPRHPAEVTPWPHQGHDFAWLTAIAGQTQSCTSANLLQWQKFLSALASLTKPEQAAPVPTETCSSLSSVH